MTANQPAPGAVADARPPLATEVLEQITATQDLVYRFKTAAQSQLDLWQVQSLAITEQSLARARLAFSQVQREPRRQQSAS